MIIRHWSFGLYFIIEIEMSLRNHQGNTETVGKTSSHAQQFPIPTLPYHHTKSIIFPLKPSEASPSLNDQLSSQTYWGNVKPYCFDPSTNTPRIIINPHLIRSLLLNCLIIAVICIAVPLLTNHNLFQQTLRVSPRSLARKYSMYLFSSIWAAYEITFLVIILLGNPGYADPISQRQLSLQQQKQVLQSKQRNLSGYNQCGICKAIVDNSVFHCPVCDLCCEGFSHHCEWVGKCIGYRNQIYLSAYYYGFFAGSLLFVAVVLLQSLPFS